MTAYLAECFWPGVTAERLADLVGRAHAAAEECSEEGSPVRVLGSWLVPADEVAFLFIDAETLDGVRELQERAGVPCERIVEAIRVGPGPV